MPTTCCVLSPAAYSKALLLIPQKNEVMEAFQSDVKSKAGCFGIFESATVCKQESKSFW